MRIFVTYQNGIYSDKDQAALAIAKKYNANLLGSGCWLCPPFTRDLEWSVLAEHSRAMKQELLKVGFEVRLV